MSILDRENRRVSLKGRPNKLSIFKILSVEKVAKNENYQFLSRKSKHMDAGSNKKKSLDYVETCRFFIKKPEKYLNWVEQSRKFFLLVRESRK